MFIQFDPPIHSVLLLCLYFILSNFLTIRECLISSVLLILDTSFHNINRLLV